MPVSKLKLHREFKQTLTQTLSDVEYNEDIYIYIYIYMYGCVYVHRLKCTPMWFTQANVTSYELY